MKFFILLSFSMLTLFQVAAMNTEAECLPEYQFDGKKITLTEKEWKEKLTPEQFYILRDHGTEKPFENLYDTNKAKGIYVCAGCALPLYSSQAKYDSGTGWPSFKYPLCKNNVTLTEEGFWFLKKTEVSCSRCGGHLGHVFEDGPEPLKQRYCMNSAALKFIPK